MSKKIDAIQKELKRFQLDGWLIYVWRDVNPVAVTTLELPEDQTRSRRAYYYIPAEGTPRKLQHAIEPHTLEHLPGDSDSYLSYQSLQEKLKVLIGSDKKIAMEYSPNCLIPTVSWVDGGTIELIRSFGVEIVSSAELIQIFEATLTDDQIAGHHKTAELLRDIAHEAFDLIGKTMRKEMPISEADVAKFILLRFEQENLESEGSPIVAINANASDPHYLPVKGSDAFFKKGDMVLIDLWAKVKNDPSSIWGDETWMAYIGDTVPADRLKIWELVRDARLAGYNFVVDRFAKGETVYGWEVDDATRKPIDDAGYGEYFIHRTGHSITTSDHGNGANIDNLETKELRPIIPRTIFSIEPGIYLPEFGVRSEFDVVITPDGKVEFARGTSQETIINIKV